MTRLEGELVCIDALLYALHEARAISHSGSVARCATLSRPQDLGIRVNPSGSKGMMRNPITAAGAHTAAERARPLARQCARPAPSQVCGFLFLWTFTHTGPSHRTA